MTGSSHWRWCAVVVIAVVTGFAIAADTTASVQLDEVERAWLKSHPTIRYSPDPSFPPFEFVDSSEHYRGIAADYLALVETKLGIKFQFVRLSNWDDVLEYAQQRKIDMLPAAAESPQRKKYLQFTKPHIHASAAIVTASGENFSRLYDLNNKTVVVVSGYVWEDLIAHSYPQIKLVKAPDIPTALRMTSLGAVDAMVTDVATTSHYINQEGITNLRVSGKPPQALELAMATRSDWPELNGILNKALATITNTERMAIQQRWIRLKLPSMMDNMTFWYTTAAVLGVVILGISAIMMWNRTLQRQVTQRTQELENAQMQLIQAAKLESVGRLAAGVAHEVKNPLTIIQLGVDFLTNEVKADDVSSGVIRDMDDAVRRADTVVKGLVDFSREQALERTPTEINRLIDDSLHLVNHEFVQRNIDVRKELAAKLPSVHIDSNKVQQVFINLFVNAAHAMDKDGELSVKTRHVPRLLETELQRDMLQSFRSGDEAIIVWVEDTGPGIDDSELSKIFDPFFTTKPIGQGTGLGLSVTRNIMELHQGSIDICNRDGGGVSIQLMFRTTQES